MDFIEERSPQILTEYRSRLEDKVKELLSNTAMEESRIAAEVTIYADKICVDEETVRLRSHIHNTRNELLSGESVGRKLDFIAQEMNREANTILSKSTDLSISDKAIALRPRSKRSGSRYRILNRNIQISTLKSQGEHAMNQQGILVVVSGFSGAGREHS